MSFTIRIHTEQVYEEDLAEFLASSGVYNVKRDRAIWLGTTVQNIAFAVNTCGGVIFPLRKPNTWGFNMGWIIGFIQDNILSPNGLVVAPRFLCQYAPIGSKAGKDDPVIGLAFWLSYLKAESRLSSSLIAVRADSWVARNPRDAGFSDSLHHEDMNEVAAYFGGSYAPQPYSTEGYGHHYQTILASDSEGVKYRGARFRACYGPGYSCSYDHNEDPLIRVR